MPHCFFGGTSPAALKTKVSLLARCAFCSSSFLSVRILNCAAVCQPLAGNYNCVRLILPSDAPARAVVSGRTPWLTARPPGCRAIQGGLQGALAAGDDDKARDEHRDEQRQPHHGGPQHTGPCVAARARAANQHTDCELSSRRSWAGHAAKVHFWVVDHAASEVCRSAVRGGRPSATISLHERANCLSSPVDMTSIATLVTRRGAGWAWSKRVLPVHGKCCWQKYIAVQPAVHFYLSAPRLSWSNGWTSEVRMKQCESRPDISLCITAVHCTASCCN